jgi:hypothetical protein
VKEQSHVTETKYLKLGVSYGLNGNIGILKALYREGKKLAIVLWKYVKWKD